MQIYFSWGILQKRFGVRATLVSITLFVAVGRVWRSGNGVLSLRGLDADFHSFIGAFGSPDSAAMTIGRAGESVFRAQKSLQADCTRSCSGYGNSPHVSEEPAAAFRMRRVRGRGQVLRGRIRVSTVHLNALILIGRFFVHQGSF